MQCPKCRFENREGVKFCEGCGAKLEMICPECSAAVPLDRNFCGECGCDLSQYKESPRIDYEQPRSYTPKFLAEKILTARSAIEGERKLVTVLFADVAGFTPMSEKLDPEDVHEIMDGCFRILMDEIHRFEGTVNEFRGDGVMALFGAPIAHEDHAQRACHAALAIQEGLAPYAERLRREYGIDFKMRIGLNSGPVVVGAIGDDLRMDYTAQGDTANLAARMESNAEPGTILVSENTHRLAGRFFDFQSLGGIRVKGKEKAIPAYRLIRPSEVETRIEASVAKGLTRFVGRRRELETLKEAFEKARSGEGQVVGVVGEAGVGKSRLLLEFRNKLPKGEYLYLEGRSLHYGSSMPYLPILDALRSYLGIKEGEQESVIKEKMQERIVGSEESLTKCLPPIEELFSVTVDDEEFLLLEPKEKREKTFEALRDILVRGSHARPIVLAIEDLHWIDKTTEEFLDYMIGWLPSTSILLILLYRPEYTHQWGSKSYYAQIGVGQLSSGTSAELVQAILEGGDVVPELRELILSRASGNPLYMEELTHALLENGSVCREGDQYVLAREASEITVPDTVQGIIAARMDRLEDTLKRIMQVASVIGRQFAFCILHAITEMKQNLKSNLLNLQGLEFIYEKSLFPELEYIFRHALTQEVAYNSLLLKRRKEIHERIGRAIEELYPDRVEEFYEMLAYHYSKSDNLEKAADYSKLAGNKATRSNSLPEAVRYYRQGIGALKQLPATEENKKDLLELILLMALIMRALGYPEDSLEILQLGETLAKELKDEKSVVTIYGLLAVWYTMAGNDPSSAGKYIELCFEELELIEDVELMAPIAYDICTAYSIQGLNFKAVELAPRIIALLERTKKEPESFGRPYNVYSMLHGWYGFGLGALGRFADGERILDKGLSFALEINNVYSIAVIEVFYGSFYYFRGDGQNDVLHFQKSIEYLEKGQIVLFFGLARSWLGFGYHLLGDNETALGHCQNGLKIQTDLGIPFWMSCHHICLGTVYQGLGDLSKAEFHAEQALKLSRENKEKTWEGEAGILLGLIIGKARKSQLDRANDHMRQGIRLLKELRMRPRYAIGYFELGALCAEAGRKEEALEHLKKAETMFQDMGMDYWLGKTQEVLARL